MNYKLQHINSNKGGIKFKNRMNNATDPIDWILTRRFFLIGQS